MKEIKRVVIFILAAALMLSMTACGKSSQVKNVEGLISAIGEVSLASDKTIESAQTAYNNLVEKDKSEVENYAELESALKDYDTLISDKIAEAQTLLLEEFDAEKACSLFEELKNTSHYDNNPEFASALDLIMKQTTEELCYPNSFIIKAQYIITEKSKAFSSDNEKGQYTYPTSQKMMTALNEYYDYLSKYFTLDSKGNGIYRFIDKDGNTLTLNGADFDAISVMMVRFNAKEEGAS